MLPVPCFVVGEGEVNISTEGTVATVEESVDQLKCTSAYFYLYKDSIFFLENFMVANYFSSYYKKVQNTNPLIHTVSLYAGNINKI